MNGARTYGTLLRHERARPTGHRVHETRVHFNDPAYMRHGGDGCGCNEAQGVIVCECGDGSKAGNGVGAPLHAHYTVRA